MSNKKGMDYDKLKIAEVYTKARTLSPTILEKKRKIILQFVPEAEIREVLDLGTGTGLFTKFLRSTFAAAVIGVDPSEEMLREARKSKERNIKFLQGTAEKIPLPKAAVDLVFLSMVYPAFRSVERALSEIYRVLRPGGYAVVIQATRETNKKTPFFNFFPESKKVADAINPSVMEIRRAFLRQNFSKLDSRDLRYKVAANLKAYYNIISLRGYSVLRLIPDKIFENRLKKFAGYSLDPKRTGPVYQTTSVFIFKRSD